MHAVATTLNQIATELNESYLEREEVIHSMMLALLAGEHHCQLGVPGTSKSQLVDALVGSIENASYFKVGLSKTRPAEAVLGPLDIKKFRENGDYHLKRNGFATSVDLIFLDEIGKMSPVLGHDLLSLLNEREYHEVNGGLSVHAAPLHTAFTASNELPTNESDDAAAMWDRLLVRVVVETLQESSNFAKLLTGNVVRPTTKVDFVDLVKATQEVRTIQLSQEALEGMVALRMKFAAEHIYPSDRRWKASVKILQAAAFFAGHEQIEEDDLAVLRWTLWETPTEHHKVVDLCMSASNPFVDDLLAAKSQLAEIAEGITDRVAGDPLAKREYGKEANQKLIEVRASLDALLNRAKGRAIPGFKAASDEHMALSRTVMIEFLDTTEDVADVVLKKRAGLGDGGNS